MKYEMDDDSTLYYAYMAHHRTVPHVPCRPSIAIAMMMILNMRLWCNLYDMVIVTPATTETPTIVLVLSCHARLQ